MAVKQTAGRTQLGEFAPKFAELNDDVLFGENWNNQDIDVKTRCIITVTALIASGMINTSLVHHFENAKAHGVTQKEIAAVITHIAFYAGWPKGWAAFNFAKDVWSIDEGDLSYEDEAMRAHAKKMIFPIGEPNDKFAQYFTGKSFLAPVSTSQVGIFNVTFEPGCRNNWHIHHAKSGGGQILICIAGRGYYQEEGKEKWDTIPLNLVKLKKCLAKWQNTLYQTGWNSLFMNNHDLPRIVSRWGNDGKYRKESATMLATMLHGMQGTPYIYQGEELGMTNVQFDSIEEYEDIETLNMYKERLEKGYQPEEILHSIYARSRDNARTPMQWDDSKNAGFTGVRLGLIPNPGLFVR